MTVTKEEPHEIMKYICMTVMCFGDALIITLRYV